MSPQTQTCDESCCDHCGEYFVPDEPKIKCPHDGWLLHKNCQKAHNEDEHSEEEDDE